MIKRIDKKELDACNHLVYTVVVKRQIVISCQEPIINEHADRYVFGMNIALAEEMGGWVGDNGWEKKERK